MDATRQLSGSTPPQRRSRAEKLVGRLQEHNTSPRVSGREGVRSADHSRLQTHHALVLIVGKVTHRFGLLAPRIPDDELTEALLGDTHERTALFEDVHHVRGVVADHIHLGGERELMFIGIGADLDVVTGLVAAEQVGDVSNANLAHVVHSKVRMQAIGEGERSSSVSGSGRAATRAVANTPLQGESTLVGTVQCDGECGLEGVRP
mmetsp:Transcript_13628/g.41110  ORF Transcript_13628/g.41110 Transcript_13628/m.41110 type:complete len:206 (-) Transcript_13628:553-1170(-)